MSLSETYYERDSCNLYFDARITFRFHVIYNFVFKLTFGLLHL